MRTILIIDGASGVPISAILSYATTHLGKPQIREAKLDELTWEINFVRRRRIRVFCSRQLTHG